MLRSYEFYERHLNLKSYEIDKIARIIKDVENGIYNEDEIRSLEADGLKFCICEGKYEIFEKAVLDFKGPLCYNGDVNSLEDYEKIQQLFPKNNYTALYYTETTRICVISSLAWAITISAISAISLS